MTDPIITNMKNIDRLLMSLDVETQKRDENTLSLLAQVKTMYANSMKPISIDPNDQPGILVGMAQTEALMALTNELRSLRVTILKASGIE